MIRIGKSDVEAYIRIINNTMPQPSKNIKREIDGDYYPQYGGWYITYFDGKGRCKNINSTRISHKEAFRLLEGIEFSLNHF